MATGSKNINQRVSLYSKYEDALLITGMLLSLFLIVATISYFSSRAVLSGPDNSTQTFAQFIQMKMLERSVSSLESDITQLKCMLPENKGGADCQTIAASIQSLWREINWRTNEGQAVFSLFYDKVPSEYRTQISTSIEQLRKQQMEQQAKLTQLRYADNS